MNRIIQHIPGMPQVRPNVLVIISTLVLFSCANSTSRQIKEPHQPAEPQLVVLGTLQDGGSPHAGCNKKCCKALFKKADSARKVVCLGLIDPINKQTWLFEATPDISSQMKMLKNLAGFQTTETPSGIFLTHAHIGHYSGLMYLGREAMNAQKVPVFALPRMKNFLENNGPWSQLVKLQNIELKELQENLPCLVSKTFTITAFCVPHRDEFSETVGYKIQGPDKSVLFIPDIDKWEKWDKNIVEEIKKVDYAFIDATFYSGEEINHRNIKEIPHPFVIESCQLFDSIPTLEKNKVHFIHFNHSNPLLIMGDKEYMKLKNKGYNIATFGDSFVL